VPGARAALLLLLLLLLLALVVVLMLVILVLRVGKFAVRRCRHVGGRYNPALWLLVMQQLCWNLLGLLLVLLLLLLRGRWGLPLLLLLLEVAGTLCGVVWNVWGDDGQADRACVEQSWANEGTARDTVVARAEGREGTAGVWICCLHS
jgi:hypothetical protein